VGKKKGLLASVGYDPQASKRSRYKALRKAMRRFGGRKVFVALTAKANTARDINTAETAIRDRTYVARTAGFKTYMPQKEEKSRTWLWILTGVGIFIALIALSSMLG